MVPFQREIEAAIESVTAARLSLADRRDALREAESQLNQTSTARAEAAAQLRNREMALAIQSSEPPEELLPEERTVAELGRRVRFITARRDVQSTNVAAGERLLAAAVDSLGKLWRESADAALANTISRYRELAGELKRSAEAVVATALAYPSDRSLNFNELCVIDPENRALHLCARDLFLNDAWRQSAGELFEQITALRTQVDEMTVPPVTGGPEERG